MTRLPLPIAGLLAGLALGGCASIDLPDLDMLDRAFRNTETDLADYPSVADAPVVPADLRDTQSWDASAKAIMAERDAFDAPAVVVPLDSARTLAEIEALKAQVRAYKIDDPEG